MGRGQNISLRRRQYSSHGYLWRDQKYHGRSNFWCGRRSKRWVLNMELNCCNRKKETSLDKKLLCISRENSLCSGSAWGTGLLDVGEVLRRSLGSFSHCLLGYQSQETSSKSLYCFSRLVSVAFGDLVMQYSASSVCITPWFSFWNTSAVIFICGLGLQLHFKGSSQP